jgi:hypothetical protein
VIAITRIRWIDEVLHGLVTLPRWPFAIAAIILLVLWYSTRHVIRALWEGLRPALVEIGGLLGGALKSAVRKRLHRAVKRRHDRARRRRRRARPPRP